MEVKGKATETKSESDTQTSNSLVVQGITFSHSWFITFFQSLPIFLSFWNCRYVHSFITVPSWSASPNYCILFTFCFFFYTTCSKTTTRMWDACSKMSQLFLPVCFIWKMISSKSVDGLWMNWKERTLKRFHWTTMNGNCWKRCSRHWESWDMSVFICLFSFGFSLSMSVFTLSDFAQHGRWIDNFSMRNLSYDCFGGASVVWCSWRFPSSSCFQGCGALSLAAVSHSSGWCRAKPSVYMFVFFFFGRLSLLTSVPRYHYVFAIFSTQACHCLIHGGRGAGNSFHSFSMKEKGASASSLLTSFQTTYSIWFSILSNLIFRRIGKIKRTYFLILVSIFIYLFCNQVTFLIATLSVLPVQLSSSSQCCSSLSSSVVGAAILPPAAANVVDVVAHRAAMVPAKRHADHFAHLLPVANPKRRTLSDPGEPAHHPI